MNNVSDKKCLELEIITTTTLQKAICVALEYKIMERDAEELAQFVLSFFRMCDDRFLDNILSDKERDVFYILEDKGLVKTDKEELKLPTTTRPYILHYWMMGKENILKNSKAFQKEPKKPVLSEEAGLQAKYDELPEDAWVHASP